MTAPDPVPAAEPDRWESITPTGDRLLIDCPDCGEIGSVPAVWATRDRASEFDRVAEFWAEHVAEVHRG